MLGDGRNDTSFSSSSLMLQEDSPAREAEANTGRWWPGQGGDGQESLLWAWASHFPSLGLGLLICKIDLTFLALSTFSWLCGTS